MTGVSLERLADALYPKPEPKNGTAYGTVESVNPDGSYQVKLNASATTTRCAKLCDASVGDRVLVLIQANGHCAAIGRVGGSLQPAVLYNNASGTTGTVTLSESAADFDYMRIYFKDNNSYHMSVDVYSPDGKTVSPIAPYPDSSAFWVNGTAWSISGTSITNARHGNAEIAGGYVGSSDNISIVRVEAWNEPQPRNANNRGGGGGEGHTYTLIADSQNPLKAKLTEDGTTAAGSFTVPDGTTSAKGVVQLSSSTSSSSETTAATSKAVKDALDAAKAYADSIMPNAVQSGSNLAVE